MYCERDCGVVFKQHKVVLTNDRRIAEYKRKRLATRVRLDREHGLTNDDWYRLRVRAGLLYLGKLTNLWGEVR